MATIDFSIKVNYQPLAVIIITSSCIHYLKVDLVSEENSFHIFHNTGKKPPNFAMLYRMSLEISRARYRDNWTCHKDNCIFSISNAQARGRVSLVFKKTWKKLPRDFHDIFKNLYKKMLEQRARPRDFKFVFETRSEDLSNNDENTSYQNFGTLNDDNTSSPNTSCSIPTSHNSQMINNSSHYNIGNVANNYEITKFFVPIRSHSFEVGPFDVLDYTVANCEINRFLVPIWSQNFGIDPFDCLNCTLPDASFSNSGSNTQINDMVASTNHIVRPVIVNNESSIENDYGNKNIEMIHNNLSDTFDISNPQFPRNFEQNSINHLQQNFSLEDILNYESYLDNNHTN
ncbi:1428_t:CDS:1 [Ambispora leptoticha]|uniref:1428_t:CDS:1 n=1 Tax=Ambispora leptoticha TaxID=144679 RepID=A0A9N8WE77_9GLOM|nr:1428_t:CDS:1 [Ambispora leptoticha]